MVLRSALSANTPGDLALVAARRCTALWSRSGSSLGAVVATTMVLETPTCAAYHTNTTAGNRLPCTPDDGGLGPLLEHWALQARPQRTARERP